MVYTKEDGHLAQDGLLYNDQIFQVLNNMVILFNLITTTVISGVNGNSATVTLNGLNPPSLTTAQITALTTASPLPVPFGTIWFNNTLNKLQFWGADSTVHTITSA